MLASGSLSSKSASNIVADRPCCAAGESGPSCVACRVVNGYRGEDPAALSSALLSRAAGSFELSVSALCSVSVHEHGAFNGWRADFINGDYDGPAFLRSGAHDNAASSVQVHGEGCVARESSRASQAGKQESCALDHPTLSNHLRLWTGVYESPDLGVSGGWQVSLREGEYGLAELRAAGAVDEQLSSISVFHVPPGPWRMGKRQRSLCPTEACLGTCPRSLFVWQIPHPS